MLQGFKDFISRGNVVDLAVGVVIGAAFSAVVKALVDGILDPVIAGIFGEPDFKDIGAFMLGESLVQPGLLVTAIIQFLLIAAAIYFVIVLPMNRLTERREKESTEAAAEEPAPSPEAILLSEIRDLLAQK